MLVFFLLSFKAISLAARITGFDRLCLLVDYEIVPERNPVLGDSVLCMPHSLWWLRLSQVPDKRPGVTCVELPIYVWCNLHVMNTVKNGQERNPYRFSCSEVVPQDELHSDISWCCCLPITVLTAEPIVGRRLKSFSYSVIFTFVASYNCTSIFTLTLSCSRSWSRCASSRLCRSGTPQL
jgi:hypothetical protein